MTSIDHIINAEIRDVHNQINECIFDLILVSVWSLVDDLTEMEIRDQITTIENDILSSLQITIEQ